LTFQGAIANGRAKRRTHNHRAKHQHHHNRPDDAATFAAELAQRQLAAQPQQRAQLRAGWGCLA